MRIYLPSRLCREESNVFLFFTVIFSHILTCFARDCGTKVRPQTGHGVRGNGAGGSGATGAMGWVGTGGEGGGPTLVGGGVRNNGRNDSSSTGDAAPAGSGDGVREGFEDCSC